MTGALRVLLHAPRGRDAQVIRDVLDAQRIENVCCASHDEMLALLQEGAAVAIVTEEAFGISPSSPIDSWLRQQPKWSDFPFIVLTTRRTTPRPLDALRSLHALGNVVLLERPVNAETLLRATEAALRARGRQYATRAHLEEIDATRATVERMNRSLESRIGERTRELAEANDRLMAEIAERERAQSTLVQVQKMEAIGRLTGGIAHDFNNLLQIVGMNLEMLSRLATEPKAAAVADRAKRAVSRGSKLTAQLLSFARVQSLLPRVTDVRALLLGMQELLAVSVGSTIRIELDLCDDPSWARLDASQFEMAVLNLVVNAKDAMPGGGLLRLSTRLEPGDATARGSVVLAVADQGMGIPAALLSKVFDPFFTTKPVGSGTGLGLSQVYGFARQSGGSARIVSTLGRGTTVEMSFPSVEAASTVSSNDDAGTAVEAIPRRILVIEDDPEVRRVIVDSLELSGHSVTSATNGIDGLAALRKTPPELLIVDYAMPKMNGAEVIKRARERLPNLPVVLATGYADMAEVAGVLGTQSILIKPFDIAALLHAVGQATGGPPEEVAPRRAAVAQRARSH
jgi:signal transduction histidine kinase/ActR/RegA family two-component response regulator